MSVRKMVELKPVTPAVLNMIWQKLNQMNIAIHQRQWHQVRVQERYIQNLIKAAEKEPWWQQDEEIREKVKLQYCNMVAQITAMKAVSEDKMEQLLNDREGILAYGRAPGDQS